MAEKQNDIRKTVMSEEAYNESIKKLEYLKTTRRAEIAEQISVARGFGDLSENAEYDEAKNEQSKLEAEINDLENTLRTAEVINESSVKTDRVNVGTVVIVYDEEMQEEVEYAIVGARESDPLNNKISNESPVGAALLGHKKNETVRVQTPGGEIVLKILKIHRP